MIHGTFLRIHGTDLAITASDLTIRPSFPVIGVGSWFDHMLTGAGASGTSTAMARKLRVQYPGAIYHVMNRGDRREPIFKDDHGRVRFLETFAETCASRLHTGAWTYLNNRLCWERRASR